MEHDLIQYFIVNQDLKMSVGKISAQVSHGATIMAIRDRCEPNFMNWLDNVKRAIVLQADEDTMRKLHSKILNSICIIDKGFTEIPENSFTVLVLPIMTREKARQYVGNLKLLRN